MIIVDRTRLIACLDFLNMERDERMRTMKRATFLLLAALLLSSCSSGQGRYESMAERGQWQQILELAQKNFERRAGLEDLYWMAMAHRQGQQTSLGRRAIELYFALAHEEEITVEARRLALELGEDTLALEQGRFLYEHDLLDSQNAQAYYRSLIAFGMVDEANQIFITYLSASLSPQAYARLLIQSRASASQIEKALEGLDHSVAVALLWERAQDEIGQQESAALSVIAAGYEGVSLNDEDRLLLYAALHRFYQMADLRVLANKYRLLSQGP